MDKSSTLLQKYGFKKEKDEVFPPMLFAEITNICNLNCIHCPYTYISKQKFYKPRHMELDIYKKIVDEVSQYKGTILRLVCDGEPMMHPKLLEMIAYTRERGISPICLNTNGTLINEKVSLEILRLEVDVVEISLDALNKNTYEYIRRGADYEEVMSNVDRFIELRNKLKAETKIMVSIIDQSEVKNELVEFITYWTPKVDKVIIRTYTSIGGLMNCDKLKINDNENRWPCPLLWTRIFINVDGFLKFCVEDWLDKTIVGDIRYNTIKEAWTSNEYQKLRDSLLSKKFKDIDYCSNCIDWPARKWDYDYFYALEKIL